MLDVKSQADEKTPPLHDLRMPGVLDVKRHHHFSFRGRKTSFDFLFGLFGSVVHMYFG